MQEGRIEWVFCLGSWRHVVHEMNRMRCLDERVARTWILQDLESSRKRSGRATNSLEDHP